MSNQEDSFDQLECSRCGISVEQILALQCNHNLCLDCASKIISASTLNSPTQSKKNENALKCEICGVLTVLDPKSAEVLRNMKEEQIITDQQSRKASQSPKSDVNYEQQVQIQQQQQLLEQEKQLQQQQKQQYNEINQLNSFQKSPSHQGSRSIHSQNNSDLYQQQQENRIQQQQSSQQQSFIMNDNQRCRDHPSEETILYCFTCEAPCICVECYLNGLHKNHEVSNIRKKYDNLSNNVDDLRFKLKTRADLLLNDESRLTQKKRELVEIVSQAKQHIKKSFDEILLVIEQKQNQLLQDTESMMEEKFMEIDRCLGKVQNQANYLQTFDQNLEKMYYQSNRTTESDIKAFNFYAENKQRVLLNLDEMDANFFTQIKDKMHCDFVLDLNSVYQHLESVKMVKMEIMAARGLESLTPSQLEQQLFEKAKQDRNNRRFEHFQGIKKPISQTQLNQTQQQQQGSILIQQSQKVATEEDSNYLDYVQEKAKQQQEEENNNNSRSIQNKPPIKQQQQNNNNISLQDSILQQQQQQLENEKRVQFQQLQQKQQQFQDRSNNQKAPVFDQLEDLKRQLSSNKQQSSSHKENRNQNGGSTMDRINALRSRFQPSQH